MSAITRSSTIASPQTKTAPELTNPLPVASEKSRLTLGLRRILKAF